MVTAIIMLSVAVYIADLFIALHFIDKRIKARKTVRTEPTKEDIEREKKLRRQTQNFLTYNGDEQQ